MSTVGTIDKSRHLRYLHIIRFHRGMYYVGKALLQKWGLPEQLRGIGNCILGFADDENPGKPRKDGRILKVD